MKHDALFGGCCVGTTARVLAAAVTLLTIAFAIDTPASRIVHGQTSTAGRHFYVAPNGSPSNDGSAARPLDLATALSRTSPARPGDTVWLRGGTYRGAFVSDLTGTAAAPIVVRQYPGERATIDSSTSALDALSARGAYTWFWGFEITSSDAKRITAESGSWPSDLRRGYGAVTRAPGIKFINLVVHDNANGLGIWAESIGGEAYGNLVYYNGWEGPDRAHGHGIYTQNQSGTRRIAENILFDQFSHGIHAYGSASAPLDYITLEGNISFMNGALSSGGIHNSGRDVLLGGERVAASPVLTGNATYRGQTNIGYNAGCTNGRVTNNYFAGPVILAACNPTMTGNTFYDESWPRYGTWPTQYPQNTYHSALPAGPVVKIRRNAYEPGRAHVVVYNWGHASQVSIDLSRAGLVSGTAYQIRDAQNYFGAPVASGTYNGTAVRVPLTGLSAVRPVGNVPVIPAHTAPEFAVFVVVPGAGSTAPVPPTTSVPAPTATLTLSSASISQGQSATLSWSTSNAAAVSISPAIGSVASSGSRTITPAVTTTYTITATNTAGESVTRSATLTVSSTSAPTLRITTPANGLQVTAPAAVAIEAAAANVGTTVARVSFYANGTLVGSATQSPYRVTWNATNAGTYSLTAQAFSATGVVASAPAIAVTVSASAPTTPPAGVSIRLTSPLEGAVVVNQSTVTLAAEAVDPQGTITKVEFYRGPTNIGTAWTKPFTLKWSHVTTGTYVLTARAYDKRGVVANSAPVTIRATQPPTVRLTSPVSGTLTAPASVTLSAAATDLDGSVARVEFYRGTTLIGQATGSTFTVVWTAPPAGVHVLTARAYDNLGLATTSAPVSLTIAAAGS